MMRLVYSKIMDNHPNLKIITHHFGGIVPMLEGRIGPGNDVMGIAHHRSRIMSSLRKSLKKRPLDYFKQDFWADTAAFTADAGDQGRHGILPASTRSCSPPIARSIRKAAPCIRARRWKSSNR